MLFLLRKMSIISFPQKKQKNTYKLLVCCIHKNIFS